VGVALGAMGGCAHSASPFPSTPLEQWSLAVNREIDRAWRRTDPERPPASFEVKVSIGSHGELVQISLIRSSGLQDLDDLVLATAHSTVPFPSPESLAPGTILLFGKSFVARRR